MRLGIAVIYAVLPQWLKRFVGRHLFGWEIDRTAHIGHSIITAKQVSLGPGSVIAGRNMITNLDELRLGEGASIGSRNHVKGWWATADPNEQLPDRHPALILGDYAQLTAHHYIDCVHRLELGDYAILGGFRSTVLTHTLDVVRDRYVVGEVTIGHHAAIAAGCMLLPGTSVPARSIVSAGSVVTTKLVDELTFYQGNPAVGVRTLTDHIALFKRGTKAG